jgi:hypothetical protein
MAWIIGIISVILVIVFWRIFLPLAILAGLGIWVWITAENSEQERRARETQQAYINFSNLVATSISDREDSKSWVNTYSNEPASGRLIATGAYIYSKDGQCRIQVELRINGSKLTDLFCRNVKISEYDDIEVKFDNYQFSDTMDLEGYSDSEQVYIPSYQPSYDNHLSYDEFLNRLTSSSNVAIKIPLDSGVWVAFTLNGSTEALGQLGREKSVSVE